MMYIDGQTIVMAAQILSAVIFICGLIIAIFKWYQKQGKQDVDIKSLKTEQTLIVYGLLASLKGLKEQGCNGPVTEAIAKIEKHINQQAHK